MGMGEILVLLALAAAVALAARSLWRGHKRGGSCSGCSGGCAGCSGCSGHGSQRS